MNSENDSDTSEQPTSSVSSSNQEPTSHTPEIRLPSKLTSAGFQLRKRLGKGGQGTVFEVKREWTDRGVKRVGHYAIKVTYLDSLKQLYQEYYNKVLNDYVKGEPRLTSNLCHPNIISILKKHVLKTNKYLFVVMEKAVGCLGEKIDHKTGYTIPQPLRYVIKWTTQCLDAFTYMHHRKRIAHRDFKTDNILLNEFDDALISDFGFAIRFSGLNSRSRVGTPQYQAPEVREGEAYYPPKTDIFSLGVVIFELITGRIITDKRKFPDFARHGVLPSYDKFKRLRSRPGRKDTPRVLYDLMAKMLALDQNERPDAKALLKELTDTVIPDKETQYILWEEDWTDDEGE